MRKRKELTGQKFGRLTIKGLADKSLWRYSLNEKIKEARWLCMCECGKETLATAFALERGKKVSCGCRRDEQKEAFKEYAKVKEILPGERFGRLTVVDFAGSFKLRSEKSVAKWLCLCDCGKQISVIGSHLRSGNTQSCGCKMKDRIVETQARNWAGHRIGRLTILNERRLGGFWKAQCDCGALTEVHVAHLHNSHTQSCGCLREEGRGRLPHVPVSHYLVKNYSNWPNVYWKDDCLNRPWQAKVMNKGKDYLSWHESELEAALWAVEKKIEFGHFGRGRLLKRRDEIMSELTQA